MSMEDESLVFLCMAKWVTTRGKFDAIRIDDIFLFSFFFIVVKIYSTEKKWHLS